ncbi:amino acid adenylation domain-containing protein [Bradyrhizobium ontarionense]|uniref:Amino acid adenylation domain-containing protein n=1 Tax=Bradyrhizobium ontarionense TaxID=2898149 RepID=A0ABY3R8C8_9BRAD|nr:non-ribosomal peptide synthetase [Bradyrhizobium sp. A19]UFZ03302.1 amino acid adenylation domain-containing protein [Bradyrhizobium sp. A19]
MGHDVNGLGKTGQLTGAKRELLDARIRGVRAPKSDASFVIRPRRGDAEPAPLSFAQERLWAFEQIGLLGPAYNLPEFYRIDGPLDYPALDLAYQYVVRRHAILRTRFVSSGGEPRQVVDQTVAFRCSFEDLTSLSGQDRKVEAERLSRMTVSQPFDLTVAPLLRVLVLRLSESEHRLVVVLHHIVADGWSMELLAQEVKQSYAALREGKPSAVPELPIQYADFAIWQRAWLQGKALERHLTYWLDKLRGASGVPTIPTDKPRPAIQTFNGGTASIVLKKEVVQSLTDISTREGATLFMVVLAAFKILLSRWSGEEDIIVGTPIWGRSQQETERMIGLFVNMMPLRTSLAGEPTFLEFLQRVKETAIGAYAHQEIPYERLLEELRPSRTLSHSPLFQCVLNMLNFASGGTDDAKLKLKVLEPTDPISRFDLTLYVLASNSGLALSAVYNTDLFRPERISEFLAQFSLLISQIVQDPAQNIISFSLRTPAGQKSLPDPARPLGYGWRGAVHELFVQQAARTPDRTALATVSDTYTYGDLDRLSDRVAEILVRSGLRKGDVAAIYAHRGPELVYAILGVLKAGAAFTLLDPGYPTNGLIDRVNIARPRAWIEIAEAGVPPDALVEAAIRAANGCKLRLRRREIELASDAMIGPLQNGGRPAVGPDDLAVVTFTSGSAGRPKGVAGRHGPLSYFLPWLEQAFEFQQSDRFSMVSGLSHDPLQRDIFTPLCLGAMICIPDPEQIIRPGYMATWMREAGVTVAQLTPGLGQALSYRGSPDAEMAESTTIASLRYAFFVGDVLTLRDVAAISSIAPSATCVNLYGATETQRALSYFVVPDEGLEELGSETGHAKQVVPLGRGIGDVQLILQNRRGVLAGVGELAEICVRSHQLARGYIDDDVATEQRFFSNPFSKVAGDRFYRTGDLGRYLPDGNVEFAGRIDHQMKIRGYRIEPGEIEPVLLRVSGARDAVVVARENDANEKVLVAYLVPANVTDPPRPGDLRARLREYLPDYMVPSVFVMIDAMPLTPNGKVDRRGLPRPELRPSPSSRHLMPRTESERSLLSIWRKVLGRSDLGIEDNFFELGGHSLRAARVAAWVRQELKVDLPLRTLFAAPTIVELAAWIDVARRADGQPNFAFVRQPRPAEIPTSVVQESWLRLHRVGKPGAAFNIAYFVGLTGKLDPARLERSFDAVVQRHESLRTRFGWNDNTPFQIIDPRGRFGIEIIDVSSRSPEHRKVAARQVAAQLRNEALDLEKGPLIKVTLLRLAPEEHHLLMLVHHIVCDGWSVHILLREARAFYAAFGEERPPSLSEPQLQYADFVLWQRTREYREALAPEIAYWTERMAGAPLLNLPLARSRPDQPSYSGATRSFSLPPELKVAMQELADGEGVTPFVVLFGVFTIALMRWSGETDVVVGTPVAGRRQPNMEELIGLFINYLPLRVDLSNDPSFREVLRRVKVEVLAALDHPNASIADIQAGLSNRGYQRETPFFRIAFAMQNVPVDGAAFAGLQTYPIVVPVRTARRDLTLFVYETADAFYGIAEYATDIFEPATIDSLLQDFVTSLKVLTENPGFTVSSASRTAQTRHAEEVSVGSLLK